MSNFLSMFDFIILGMGIYITYAAITGKGKLFIFRSVKEGKEAAFRKYLRIDYAVLGATMCINGLLSILLNTVLYTANPETGAYTPNFELGAWSFLKPELLGVCTLVFMFISAVCVIIVFTLARRMTDKNAPQPSRQESAQPPQRQPGRLFPTSAFEFDEDETKTKKK